MPWSDLSHVHKEKLFSQRFTYRSPGLDSVERFRVQESGEGPEGPGGSALAHDEHLPSRTHSRVRWEADLSHAGRLEGHTFSKFRYNFL